LPLRYRMKWPLLLPRVTSTTARILFFFWFCLCFFFRPLTGLLGLFSHALFPLRRLGRGCYLSRFGLNEPSFCCRLHFFFLLMLLLLMMKLSDLRFVRRSTTHARRRFAHPFLSPSYTCPLLFQRKPYSESQFPSPSPLGRTSFFCFPPRLDNSTPFPPYAAT